MVEKLNPCVNLNRFSAKLKSYSSLLMSNKETSFALVACQTIQLLLHITFGGVE